MEGIHGYACSVMHFLKKVMQVLLCVVFHDVIDFVYFNVTFKSLFLAMFLLVAMLSNIEGHNFK